MPQTFVHPRHGTWRSIIKQSLVVKRAGRHAHRRAAIPKRVGNEGRLSPGTSFAVVFVACNDNHQSVDALTQQRPGARGRRPAQ